VPFPRLQVCLLFVLLTSCSSYVDVWVANPCSVPKSVRTFDEPPSELGAAQPTASATIGPEGVQFIDDAFADVGDRQWTIEIEGRTYPVSKDALQHNTFLIPASSC
jgi:hypothetical protein